MACNNDEKTHGGVEQARLENSVFRKLVMRKKIYPSLYTDIYRDVKKKKQKKTIRIHRVNDYGIFNARQNALFFVIIISQFLHTQLIECSEKSWKLKKQIFP